MDINNLFAEDQKIAEERRQREKALLSKEALKDYEAIEARQAEALEKRAEEREVMKDTFLDMAREAIKRGTTTTELVNGEWVKKTVPCILKDDKIEEEALSRFDGVRDRENRDIEDIYARQKDDFLDLNRPDPNRPYDVVLDGGIETDKEAEEDFNRSSPIDRGQGL